MLWSVQYFNGKMLVRSFFGDTLSKTEYPGDKNFSIATDLTFPFHLAMKKWIQTVIPAVHQQISPWCPSRLGRWKYYFLNLTQNIY